MTESIKTILSAYSDYSNPPWYRKVLNWESNPKHLLNINDDEWNSLSIKDKKNYIKQLCKLEKSILKKYWKKQNMFDIDSPEYKWFSQQRIIGQGRATDISYEGLLLRDDLFQKKVWNRNLQRMWEGVPGEIYFYIDRIKGGAEKIISTFMPDGSFESVESEILKKRKSKERRNNQQHSRYSPQQKDLDYYEVLGLPNNASNEEIKKTYKNLVKKYHPDIGGSIEMFKQIAKAYQILSNPTTRRRYDQTGFGNKGFYSFGKVTRYSIKAMWQQRSNEHDQQALDTILAPAKLYRYIKTDILNGTKYGQDVIEKALEWPARQYAKFLDWNEHIIKNLQQKIKENDLEKRRFTYFDKPILDEFFARKPSVSGDMVEIIKYLNEADDIHSKDKMVTAYGRYMLSKEIKKLINDIKR